MELSFCDLRCKEVINVVDGKSLGHIIDMVFDTRCAQILGIVVPNEKSFFSFFKNSQDIFIPYCRICKIGKDVILVQLTPVAQVSAQEQKSKKINKVEYETFSVEQPQPAQTQSQPEPKVEISETEETLNNFYTYSS